MRILLFFVFIVSLSLMSCNRKSLTSGVTGGGDTVAFKYAKLLSVSHGDGYTVVDIADPWKPGSILHTYILVPKGRGEVNHLPKGTVVRTPLQNVVSFTTVHAALANMFGKISCIAGMADIQYVKTQAIRELCKAGKIADVGNAMNPDIERIIDLQPEVVWVSPFENSGGHGKLDEIGIPIIECADYMETSPLGRAEWMKFYGMLFGVERQADSLFAVVDSMYHVVSGKAKKTASGCSFIVDKMAGPVWYVPGGQSTVGQMMADANVGYALSSDSHSGSLSLAFETVLERMGNSDIWILRYSSPMQLSYADLLSEHRGYSQIRAFREKRCYGCNVETSLFYEETPFRPDYLIADFAKIAYPEADFESETRYFHKLKE